MPLHNEMDGVPGVTQEPVEPGETFTYEFEVRAPGTYIYHGHSGLQLDRGLYGALIVEPKNETLSYDRGFVLTLDDWLDGVNGTPEDALKDLRSGGSTMEGMGEMGGMGRGTAAPRPRRRRTSPTPSNRCPIRGDRADDRVAPAVVPGGLMFR